MHGSEASSTEADRLMTVCNSCRYCEGLCAPCSRRWRCAARSPTATSIISPISATAAAPATPTASSRRRTNSTSTCRRRWRCVRADSYAAYAWPRRFQACFAATVLPSALIAASERRGVHLRLRRLERPRSVLFGIAYRPGRVLPADAAQRDGGAVRRGVPLCDRRAGDGRARLLARHRRALERAAR